MLQLLNPALLFSLFGLAVPVAIHLWSRKEGKRVKVGSIALLQAVQSQRMRSLRLNELWLLLLRCALLTLLVLLITQPQWLTNTSSQPAGWVLISPDAGQQVQADTSLRQLIDSLTDSGYELRQFSAGFPATSLTDFSTSIAPSPEIDYWSLLREVDRKLPAQTNVYLFTSERLSAAQGKRPDVDLNVQWLTLTPPDTTKTWAADAFVDTSDSLRVVVGFSQLAGTAYRTFSYPETNQPARVTVLSDTLIITPRNGQYEVSLNGTSRITDTTSLTVGIFHEKATREDARYVAAALRAIADFSGRKMTIQVMDNPERMVESRWLFWLRHDSLSKSWQARVKQGTHAIRYANFLKTTSVDTWMNLPVHSPGDIPLYQRSRADTTGIPVWEDGFGQPLLTQTPMEKGNLFHLYTRFHPQWNGLVWQETFPQAIMNLLFPPDDSRVPSGFDQRLINPKQLMPTQTQRIAQPVIARQNFRLHELLWALAALLFVIERGLSARKERRETKQTETRKTPA